MRLEPIPNNEERERQEDIDKFFDLLDKFLKKMMNK